MHSLYHHDSFVSVDFDRILEIVLHLSHSFKLCMRVVNDRFQQFFVIAQISLFHGGKNYSEMKQLLIYIHLINQPNKYNQYNMNPNDTSQKIQIYISCRNLKDLDVFSKSDPYVKVSFKRDFTQKQFMNLGRTQTIQNQLNPNYAKTFVLDYIFESRQDIRFDVYDDDGNGQNDDYIGYVQTTLGTLMGAKSQTSILDLRNPEKPIQAVGKIIIRCQKLVESTMCLNLQFRAQKLYNTDSFFDFWDKSDPYMKLLKIRQDNTYIQVGRSDVVKDNLNPVWQPIDISQTRLINTNKGVFKLQVWDWEENGKDQFIGQIQLQLKNLIPGASFKLSNPKVKNPGTIFLTNMKRYQKPTFVDYLRGGQQLNMIVAIDFTGSNGHPSQRTSLHYMNPVAPNQYQIAITAIAEILLAYDSDKRIPSFGFGAKTRFGGITTPVSHCFVLGGNPQEIEAVGVQHLMALYKNALSHVQLSGPTLFGPLLDETMKLAYACKQAGSQVYQTLLIITDGQIHDMDQTIDKICQAAHLPLSIIIVGVGSADFTNMVRLDGDVGGLYNSKGQRAVRDIVQFVPFRQVQMNGDLLARELLAELPGQLVQYMTMIGKPPGQFIPLNVSGIIKAQQNAPVKPFVPSQVI